MIYTLFSIKFRSIDSGCICFTFSSVWTACRLRWPSTSSLWHTRRWFLNFFSFSSFLSEKWLTQSVASATLTFSQSNQIHNFIWSYFNNRFIRAITRLLVHNINLTLLLFINLPWSMQYWRLKLLAKDRLSQFNRS